MPRNPGLPVHSALDQGVNVAGEIPFSNARGSNNKCLPGANPAGVKDLFLDRSAVDADLSPTRHRFEALLKFLVESGADGA